MSANNNQAAQKPPEVPKAHRTRRVKTPTVLQMEQVECGAAALAMVLAYYGKIVPLEELRAACDVSRDGVKASNVVKAARSYGLIAKGFREEVEGLANYSLPVVVYWNFNHFVVVEGFGKNKVYLNDPGSGRRTVSYEQFDGSFTGIVLTFEPGDDFRKGGNRRSTIGLLAKRLSGSRRGLLYCVLLGLMLVLPGLVIPIFTKIFVDEVLVQGLSDWVGPLLIGMTITALLRAALSWLQAHYLLRLSTKLSVGMSGPFLWHVLRLPPTFYTQRSAGEIGWRVQLNDKVAQLLSGQLASTLLNVVTVVFFAALMFRYDIVLTLVVISFAVLNMVALRFVSHKRASLNQRLLQDEGHLMGLSIHGLQSIETIKSTGGESEFFARWAGAQAKVVNTRQDLAVPTQVLTAIPPMLYLLNMTAILAVGGYRVMEGDLTIGTLVAFQSLAVSFIQPFNDFVNLGTQIQDVQGGLTKLEDVLQNPTDRHLEDDDSPATLEGPAKLTGAVELRNVTFGYSRLEPPLVENLNLTIQPGQRIAIVGLSGSGKSTVSRLVCGLLEPWSGDVLFDGMSRNDHPRFRLVNSLSLVDQQIFLFEATVSDNIRMWDPSISEERVVIAAKDALIHDDVSSRPNGYQSMIEEGGRNYSGGQRQRLEIARALSTNPSILVMDEATSALDTITEQRIDANVRRRGCTCLIVAHRLSTIRDSDEIIVLEKGKVAQRGTHDELKDLDGPYASLIAS
jgi:NHLM bacteriocin system ABC transporter peptidase/ATP-binding protein